MSSRSWNALVAEGKRLLAEENHNMWAWGDLLLEVAPMRSDVSQQRTEDGALFGTTEEAERVRMFAIEVGIAEQTARIRRMVAHRWPPTTRRHDVAWSVHTELASLENRFDLIKSRDGWKAREAREAAGRKSIEESEATIESVKRALANPSVAREVLRDRDAYRSVLDAESDLADERREVVRASSPAVAREQGKLRDDQRVVLLSNLRNRVNRLLADLQTDPPDARHRRRMAELAESLATSVDWLISFLESGDVSWDDQLRELLASGGD